MGNQVKILSSALVVVLSVGVVVFFVSASNQSDLSGSSPVVPHFVQAQEEVPPMNQISPDGTENVTLTRQNITDGVAYSFTTNEGPSYTTTLPKEVKVLIPFNSWSPDNKQFFFQQDSEYVVIRPDGEAVTILDKFSEKYPQFVMTEATGWASPQFVLVNANKPDGSAGPSFWFNPATGGFTQLSTKFD